MHACCKEGLGIIIPEGTEPPVHKFLPGIAPSTLWRSELSPLWRDPANIALFFNKQETTALCYNASVMLFQAIALIQLSNDAGFRQTAGFESVCLLLNASRPKTNVSMERVTLSNGWRGCTETSV